MFQTSSHWTCSSSQNKTENPRHFHVYWYLPVYLSKLIPGTGMGAAALFINEAN